MRKGRPPRLPEPTLSSADAVHPIRRVAWVLSLHRISSPDPAIRSRRDFVATLQARGVTADESRVSRWESGTHRMSPDVLDAYEELLGLPDQSVAAFELAQRTLAGESLPAIIHARDHTRAGNDVIDSLIAKAIDGAADGSDWHRLAQSLVHFDHVFLPRKTWEQVSAQLLSEESRSLGWARIRRSSATRLLVSNPAARKYLLRSLGAMVTDRSAQSVSPPLLTYLCDVPGERAADIVLKVLEGPQSALHEDAAWAAAVKLSRNQFSKDGLRRVLAATRALLMSGQRAQLRPGGLDLAAQLPTEEFTLLLDEIPDRNARHQLLRARETHELVADEVARDWARKLASQTLTDTWGPQASVHDPMLERLIREALFHVHRERRSQCAALLSVSPYRTALAGAAMAALPYRNLHQMPTKLLHLVGRLADPDLAPELLRLALGTENPTRCADSLTALAMTAVDLDLATSQDLVRRMHLVDNPSVSHATLLLLGMHGSDLLHGLAEQEDEWVSSTAKSWLERGARVCDPVGW